MELKHLLILISLTPLSYAASSDTASAQKLSDLKSGSKISPQEKTLFEGSIDASKRSAFDTALKAFYDEGVAYFKKDKFDEATDLFQRISAVNPDFEDVAFYLKEIPKIKQARKLAKQAGAVHAHFTAAEKAYARGRLIEAIAEWRKVLEMDPDHEPAKKRLEEANRQLAKKYFDAGHAYYAKGQLEAALESWSSAIALDKYYRRHGLLSVMSKIEVKLRREKSIALLQRAQASENIRRLPEALYLYKEALKLDERLEAARTGLARVRLELGKESFQAAEAAMMSQRFEDAIRSWKKSIELGFRIEDSRRGIGIARRRWDLAKRKPSYRKPPPARPSAGPPSTEKPAEKPKPPTTPEDAASAMTHYRNGLIAYQKKDYVTAVQSFKTAWEIDPNNERIYVALTRAESDLAAGRPSLFRD